MLLPDIQITETTPSIFKIEGAQVSLLFPCMNAIENLYFAITTARVFFIASTVILRFSHIAMSFAYYHHNRRLLLAPPEPPPSKSNYHRIILDKTLSIAFILIFFATLGYLIFTSVYHCVRRRRNLAENRITNDKNENSCMQQLQTISIFIFGDHPRTSPSSSTSSQSDPECCSVCLAEYQKGEEIRELPGCKHMFHKACIDQWLITRSSFCPICSCVNSAKSKQFGNYLKISIAQCPQVVILDVSQFELQYTHQSISQIGKLKVAPVAFFQASETFN